MSSNTQKIEQKDFATADETRTFPYGKLDLLSISDAQIGRMTLEPGWRWSAHVKPVAGTDLCEAPHFQYHVSGVLRIRTADGTEFDAGPGQVTSLPAGHDAWVIGDTPVVVVDWYGASNYARPDHRCVPKPSSTNGPVRLSMRSSGASTTRSGTLTHPAPVGPCGTWSTTSPSRTSGRRGCSLATASMTSAPRSTATNSVICPPRHGPTHRLAPWPSPRNRTRQPAPSTCRPGP